MMLGRLRHSRKWLRRSKSASWNLLKKRDARLKLQTQRDARLKLQTQRDAIPAPTDGIAKTVTAPESYSMEDID